ncbi:MAG: porin [bacterium]
MRYLRILFIAVTFTGAAYGVQVNVPLDEVTVNLGLLLQAGHRYEYQNLGRYHLDKSDFVIPEAELRVYGRLFNKVDYDVRSSGLRGVREAYLGTALPAGFSTKIGRFFVPFGVEATTYEGYLTCSSRTVASSVIAPGRNYGVRFDYVLERDVWPYKIGAAAGVFNGPGPLVNGAGRIYGAPVPGLKTLYVGLSYFYAKEYRWKYHRYQPREYHYLPEPRAGADLSFTAWRFEFLAEYMQQFINDYPISTERPREPYYVYKDTYARGYFGTLTYTQPLPWRNFQDLAPYARYERWDPAVIARGQIPEDRYTAGLALHFLGRNLMFRSDYTRILEDEYRTSNDVIASEFQVMF